MKLMNNVSEETLRKSFENQGFNDLQIDELLLCLTKGVDTSLVVNRKYDPLVMRYMRKVLQLNIDINKCCVNGDLDIHDFILLLNACAHKGLIEPLTHTDVWSLENYPYIKEKYSEAHK